MSAMRKIATVVGSSGIGKSKLAVELCKALSGQVINADALQVKLVEKTLKKKFSSVFIV